MTSVVIRYCSLLGALAYLGLAVMAIVRIRIPDLRSIVPLGDAIESKSGGLRGSRRALARAEDDDAEEDVAAGSSDAARTLLAAVTKGCGISVAGILIPMFAAVVVFATAGTTTPEVEFSRMLQGLIGAGAAVLAIVGKAFCVGKKARFVDDKLVKTALALDIVGFMISIATGLIGDLVVKAALAILYLACAIVSPILFVRYLGQIAKGIREPKLIGSAQRAQVSLFGAIAATVLAVVVGMVVGALRIQALGYLALAFMGLMLLVVVGAFLLYAALLAAFAVYKVEPAQQAERA